MFKLSQILNTTGSDLSFLSLLRCKWEDIHNKTEVFRYKIDNIEEKIVGPYLMQLNPNRSTKRRTPEFIDTICQPFNANKFNYSKVSPEELIFHVSDDHDNSIVHSIIVNVSPISKYHSLLCPFVDQCLPQIITAESLELCIRFMFAAGDRSFRIGFNSLCALASVNHLHYHFFIEKNVLPVEKERCKHICGPLYRLMNHPVAAFCFQVQFDGSASERAWEIFKLFQFLLRKSIAHNVFMTKGLDLNGGKEEVLRILVWPRRSSIGVKQFEAFNVAVCELSGWFPVYSIDNFNSLQQEDLENELRKWQISDFELLCNEIKMLYD